MFLKKLLISLYSLILLFLINPIIAEHHGAGEKIKPSWMIVDSENKFVTFTLTSAYNGNNGSWNYNGFYNGSANLIVPQGWNVNLKFVNPDGNYRHSIAVIKMWDGDNVPQEADDTLVAIARAYSLSPAQGCLSCKEDVKFKEQYYGNYDGLYDRWKAVQTNRDIIPISQLLGPNLRWSYTNTIIKYTNDY